MRLGQLMDPLARRLLDLRTVSPTQWLLRLLGAAATMLALVLALGGTGLFGHAAAQLVTLLVIVAILLQCRRPDSDLGLLAPSAILLGMAFQDGLTMLQAAGAGLALLLAHSAFALAGSIPVHGELGRSAWRLVASGLLLVLLVSIPAAALIMLLSAVQLGAWMMVVGVLAAIGLFIAVLPHES